MTDLNQSIPDTPEDAVRMVASRIRSLVSQKNGRQGNTFTSLAKASGTDVPTIWKLSQGKFKDLRDVSTIINVGKKIGAFGASPENGEHRKAVHGIGGKGVINPMATRIRERREQLGMTATELAKISGCTPAHVYNIESGNGSRPSALLVSRIAKTLDVTPEWIITGDTSCNEAEAMSLAKKLLELSGRDREILRTLIYTMRNYEKIVAERAAKAGRQN